MIIIFQKYRKILPGKWDNASPTCFVQILKYDYNYKLLNGWIDGHVKFECSLIQLFRNLIHLMFKLPDTLVQYIFRFTPLDQSNCLRIIIISHVTLAKCKEKTNSNKYTDKKKQSNNHDRKSTTYLVPQEKNSPNKKNDIQKRQLRPVKQKYQNNYREIKHYDLFVTLSS